MGRAGELKQQTAVQLSQHKSLSIAPLYSHRISYVTMPSPRNTNNSRAAATHFTRMYLIAIIWYWILIMYIREYNINDQYRNQRIPESFPFF